MSKGIKRDLRLALDAAMAEITNNGNRGGMYARGLSGEGYAGGYRDALMDVEQALSGYPSSNSRFWPRRRRSAL